jgi:hypothetical protein
LVSQLHAVPTVPLLVVVLVVPKGLSCCVPVSNDGDLAWPIGSEYPCLSSVLQPAWLVHGVGPALLNGMPGQQHSHGPHAAAVVHGSSLSISQAHASVKGRPTCSIAAAVHCVVPAGVPHHAESLSGPSL